MLNRQTCILLYFIVLSNSHCYTFYNGFTLRGRYMVASVTISLIRHLCINKTFIMIPSRVPPDDWDSRDLAKLSDYQNSRAGFPIFHTQTSHQNPATPIYLCSNEESAQEPTKTFMSSGVLVTEFHSQFIPTLQFFSIESRCSVS